MVLMLWFYISGLVILIGAEMNAEIEHASPYGKDEGEKVPGQKRKIGPPRCARGCDGAARARSRRAPTEVKTVVGRHAAGQPRTTWRCRLRHRARSRSRDCASKALAMRRSRTSG